ncbi:UNVERIFIED_CONTAM: hypothetical protein RMT77_019033 [Armadillidium vulgare]
MFQFQKCLVLLLLMISLCGAAVDYKKMKILRDDRYYPENGVFSFDFETEDGIVRSESGNENLVRTGIISYPLPNGEIFTLKFVADATGYKPESPYLPVPPVFPHPIPPHALRQIERGEREHAERERKEREKKMKEAKQRKNFNSL